MADKIRSMERKKYEGGMRVQSNEVSETVIEKLMGYKIN